MKYKFILLTAIIPYLFIGCRGNLENDGNKKDSLLSFVNPFIGTGGHGHTFPGATVPFGMVQLSPDTRTTGWDACGGYHYSDSSIIGFSHTHLSGTGIGDYGDILFMPFTGGSKIIPGTSDNPDSGYRSRFTHDSEKAYPGYYSVLLKDYNIRVELTALQRSGFHKYTLPVNAPSAGVIIDLSHNIYNTKNQVNEIHILSDTEIEGYKLSTGWAKEQHIYFYAKFNQPFVDYTIYDDGKENLNTSVKNSRGLKAVLNFNINDVPLMVKVGISSVDYAGAKNNMQSEIKGWDFDGTKRKASELWEKQLGKIKVSGGTRDQKVIFYTSLYHASISPNLFSDSDGRYRGMDKKIHLSKDRPVYTVFSLWDTFRALHPLMTIIDPKRNIDFINTLLNKYEQGGILPKWELAANYTGTMIGYHAIPVIYDAFSKGETGFDPEKAFESMIVSSSYDSTKIKYVSEAVRKKLNPTAKLYNETIGFIPADLENESVSKALEYAYDDWCIAEMARDMGKQDEYNSYSERSQRYQKYFDPKTGFMRGKNQNGEWRTPFDPKFSRHRNDDYTEGNAWQWTWFVPHDVKGLVELMGGVKSFETKLDSLFKISHEILGAERSPDISGLIGQYAHGNEPSHHISYLYNFIKKPWKTQNLADTIMSSQYFNNPEGLSGNEDCGQMSAWYVLNAMGFYSFCPGVPEYAIGRPLFEKVKIQLENGKIFTIKTDNNSLANKYIQSAKLNGKELKVPFFTHKNIMEGGTLEFTMGPNPNKDWGLGFIGNVYKPETLHENKTSKENINKPEN